MPAYPQVTKQTVLEFAKRWDRGGIKMILDDTSIQFAVDFTNVALRSYFTDIQKRIEIGDKVIEAAKQKGVDLLKPAPAPAAPAPAPAPAPKSSIILTD